MLAERVMEWTEQWKQQGLQQGRQEGRQEGKILLLQRQLARRFRVMPPWVAAKLEQASSEEIDLWAERILEASSLDELFQ